jgi:hypothetical protein
MAFLDIRLGPRLLEQCIDESAAPAALAFHCFARAIEAELRRKDLDAGLLVRILSLAGPTGVEARLCCVVVLSERRMASPGSDSRATEEEMRGAVQVGEGVELVQRRAFTANQSAMPSRFPL